MTIRIHKEQLKQEVLSPQVIGTSLVFSLFYIMLSSLLLNNRLIAETVAGPYSVGSKVAIITALLRGIPTLYTPFELTMLFTMGVLMGLNLILVGRSLRERRNAKNGASLGLGLLGLVATTGCASCGLTLLSLVGPTVSLTLLPFQGVPLQIVSLGLLSFSLVHTLNQRSKNCIIATK